MAYLKEATLDSRQIEDLALPYDRIIGEMKDTPHIVRGLNVMGTLGGKLVKRSGTIEVSNSAHTTRAYRLWNYETLDVPVKYYQLASMETTHGSGIFKMYYRDPDAVTPTWTSIGTLRSVDASANGRPHECVVHKGKVYIKGFPSAASGEKLGTVVFQILAGSATLKPWGILPPTVAASIAAPGTWNTIANDHAITVRVGWKYAYAWVSSTGHVSSRSPLQTNPDKNPSDTGAFTFAATAGFCPEVVVQGLADTTNFPSINIYRTMDGGGTFYFIKQIANTGSGNITFIDRYRESGAGGGTFKDPTADNAIDISNVGPDTVSNDPPPSVAPPSVVGTDTPEHSTALISWQGRIWFAHGRHIYYSSVEEIDDGIGEESYRSGLLGNFFEADHVVHLFSKTKDFLLAHTVKNTYIIRGSTKDTFDFREYLGDIGGASGHRQATTSVGDSAAWLTQDYRVAMVNQQGQVKILSDPLFTDIVDLIQAQTTESIQLVHFFDIDKDLLLVCAHVNGDTTASRQWVLDLKRTEMIDRPFWNPPWNIQSTAAAVGRLSANVANNRLMFAVWDEVGDDASLVRWDATGRTGTDFIPNTGATGFSWFADTWLMGIPTGNHLNQVSVGHRTPTVEKVVMDRTRVPQDDDPIVYYYLDDFWSTPEQGRALTELPVRRKSSKTYKTFGVNIQKTAYRVALRIQKGKDQRLFELHNMTIIWKP